ncbi:hypothetical protein [Bradyrhizobium sp. CCBAU 65884]|uniref:hypothetical protein n=1 Tax=Bradyrhizobium sp. CCBAU 65884 TaxID=722477 RepID=UPI002304DBDE|nr:hypothetical protein [Bradyrhizobium sp. CCBAU 65884]
MSEFLRSTLTGLKAAGIAGAIGALFVLGGRAGWYGSSQIVAVPLSSSVTHAGAIYFLPKTSIVLDLTWRCDIVQRGPSAKGAYDVVIDGGIEISEFSAKAEPDHAYGYAIKSDTIDGIFWRTDLDITLSNGMLVSLNATSSGQIPNQDRFEKIFTSIASAAPLINKTAAVQDADAAAQRVAICGTPLIQATETKDANGKAVGLSVRKVVRFDPDDCPTDFQKLSDRCILDGQLVLSSLLLDGEAAAEVLRRSSVEIQTVRFKAVAAKASSSGIAYRTPGSANVRVCSPQCDIAGRTIAANNFVVPQFGTIGVVSIERRMFSDRTTQLKFGAWGELTEAKFTDAASVAADKGEK